MEHLRAAFDSVVEGMEWGEILSTLDDMIEDILGGTTITRPPSPPPPSPPPPIPAWPRFDTHPQPVEHLGQGNGGCAPVGAAPCRLEHLSLLMAAPGVNAVQAAPIIYQGPLYDHSIMQSGDPYGQAGAYSQGQYNKVPVVQLPEGLNQYLLPVGFLNGEVVYRLAAGVFTTSGSAAPQTNTSMPKERKGQNQQANEPYIKKPPNAFMLFRKEQRPNVVAELNITDSAAVNTVLGRKWNALSKEEQAKYYEEADIERRLHAQQHPNWSSKDNYGTKRKRTRRKVSTKSEVSSSTPGEVTQQAKRLRVSPVHTAVMEPFTSQAVLMQPPHSLTAATPPAACHWCTCSLFRLK